MLPWYARPPWWLAVRFQLWLESWERPEHFSFWQSLNDWLWVRAHRVQLACERHWLPPAD